MKQILIALLFSLTALMAKAPVSIDIHSYQEIVVKDKSGKKVKKWVPVKKVVPGDIVKYVDTINNDTDKELTDVKVKNPINKNVVLVKGSEKSNAKFTTLYSIDGGKSYATADKLFIKGKDGVKKMATVKDYNALEFTVDKVPAHSKVDVEFKVKIK